MRFTRRLISRRSPHAFAIFSSALIAGAAWSCGSDESRDPLAEEGPDASSPDVVPAPDDASAEDVSRPRDAGFIDAAPHPVVCTSPPCALSLVTSSLAPSSDSTAYEEGFCSLMQDGTVVCWGANASGQLGRGEEAGSADSATPARVVGLSNAVSLHHTCAVDEDGAAFCWGTGPFAQNGTEITTARAPVKLPIPAASHVDATSSTACAVTGDTVRCWGSNENAQVGPFATNPRLGMFEPTVIPLAVAGPVRDIVVSRATFIVHADGTTESWGGNPPLGRPSPLFPDPYPHSLEMGAIGNLDVGDENACATAGGIGHCWGKTLPSFTESTPPKLDLANTLPTAVSTPEPVVQIATTANVVRYELGAPIAQRQRWCAIGVSGAVYCWGTNTSGQAGDGTKNHAYEAVEVVGLPGPAAQVKTAPESTCVLLTSGKVYCWGSNYYGQLGNGNIRQPSITPQEVVMP